MKEKMKRKELNKTCNLNLITWNEINLINKLQT